MDRPVLDGEAMPAHGYPEVYGVAPDGHCGHCGGLPEHAAHSEYGIFCMACFRWLTYTGPKQYWGDGMKVTQHRVHLVLAYFRR